MIIIALIIITLIIITLIIIAMIIIATITLHWNTCSAAPALTWTPARGRIAHLLIW